MSEHPTKHPLRVVSPARSAANARNALHSQGPSTPEGRAVASRNATQHGLLAETVIIPGLETREAWEVHQAGILANLDPVGYLESELASRVALLTWRLRRVAWHEAEQIAVRRARAQRRASRTISQGVQQLATHTDELHLALQTVVQLTHATPLSERSATLILRALKTATAKQVPAVGKDPWTIDRLLGVCVRLCGDNAEQAAALWNDLTNELAKESMRLEPAHAAASTLLLATLPPPSALERIQRAEAHLERCLRRTLAELRALRGHRGPARAALPHEKLPNELYTGLPRKTVVFASHATPAPSRVTAPALPAASTPRVAVAPVGKVFPDNVASRQPSVAPAAPVSSPPVRTEKRLEDYTQAQLNELRNRDRETYLKLIEPLRAARRSGR